MRKLLLAAAIVAGSCSLVMAQGPGSSAAGGGQGPSSAPSLQKQGAGTKNTERAPAPRVATVKKKKKTSKPM